MKRTCMVSTCGTEVGRGHLMCAQHWHKLPDAARRNAQTRLRGWRDESAARLYLEAYARNLAKGETA